MFDTHTHAQPSAAAAQEFLAQFGMGDGHPDRGTVASLIDEMDEVGGSRALIIPCIPAQRLVAAQVSAGADRDQATNDVLAQWRALNRWATTEVARPPTRLVCLVGVDPVLMSSREVADEVGEQIAAGAAGIKIAPMFLHAHPDDEVMEVVWQLARQHDVPVLSECGAGVRPGTTAWGHPRHFEAVCSSYPDVRIQLAHLALGAEDALVELIAEHSNVWADTSIRLGRFRGEQLVPDDLVRLMRRIGIERVLFGTNYPMADLRTYAKTLRALPLREDELQAVAHRNADSLYPAATPPV